MNAEAFEALQDILAELWPYTVIEEIRRFGSIVTEEERLACIRSRHGSEGVRMYHAALRGLFMVIHPNSVVEEAIREPV